MRRVLVPASLLMVVTALAGCSGGNEQTTPSPSTASSSTPSGKVVVTEKSTATTTPSAPDGAYQPLDPSAIASTCTYEGTHLLVKGAEASDPAVSPRQGSELTLRFGSVHAKANHSAQVDIVTIMNGQTTAHTNLSLGDTFSQGPWTFSVSSICENRIEVDLTN
ncbi:hypothetical protein [Devriesea agamarum]|uniref:hypothetical protein n=1 Tax=Devriesea agamarum TaxID=472569 RepID=UPI00071CDD18|nr:hypothetical protein [Devriesea agamarum]